ncbi:hypothetical protein N0V91_008826 [Didymella pomorum]|jgi:hypothetical protein|uniref:Uncharacterized protein n=1 Tax=Didymella pomorum TaxID=749634 RepID=A0A9W8Z8M5_9PLEO|nr:hypothetical protein N0V91_008826 [Didymella pomorum]
MNPSKQLCSILRLGDHLPKPTHFTSKARNTNLSPIFTRTMASNAPDQPTKAQESHQTIPESQSSTSAPLPLPEPSSDASHATQLDVNGSGVKLDHLGPLVVNKDGSLSRIANWDKMAEIEKQNTLRILGKRNQLRLDGLKSGREEK